MLLIAVMSLFGVPTAARAADASGGHAPARGGAPCKTHPSTLQFCRSIGAPNDGSLAGGAHLDATPYLRIVPAYANFDTRWGVPELVGMLQRSAEHVAKLFPGAVLSVGDLSRKGGGDINRHHSHESGRDADVGFYMTEGPEHRPYGSAHFVPFAADGSAISDKHLRFDDARNWALVQAWLTDPLAHVTHIFVASYLRTRLLSYAQQSHVSSLLVTRAAFMLMQPRGSLPHDDHFHVRIACPPTQRETCVEVALKKRNKHLSKYASAARSSRPVVATVRKRIGTTTGAVALPLAGVMRAEPNDFDEDDDDEPIKQPDAFVAP